MCPSLVHDLTLHALCQVDITLTTQGRYVASARRALCDVTKPSLAILPAGRTTMRVVASASMPSVTLLTLYSVSSTCAASAGQHEAPAELCRSRHPSYCLHGTLCRAGTHTSARIRTNNPPTPATHRPLWKQSCTRVFPAHVISTSVLPS